MFKNNGKQWLPIGEPIEVFDHDFPDPSLSIAIPYGVLDMKNNQGFVVIGTSHDTSEFAVNSIYQWWSKIGKMLYPNATQLNIIADSGGSNGYRPHMWKYKLSLMANKVCMPIQVSHLPPSTSKWNKIEHKLFSFISINWREQPLTDYDTIVNLISNTKTATGLTVICIMDRRSYKTGKKLTKEQVGSIKIIRNKFHGEWNYKILGNKKKL